MTRSAAKKRLFHLLQIHAVNPVVMLAHNLDHPPPGDALLETTGLRTGLPRRTPVCDGLTDEVFWLVAQRGYETDWVRNIQADPRVRVKIRTGAGLGWRAGTAHILDNDDPHEWRRLIGLGSRARRMCMAAAAVGDTDALTVRVDLEGAADGANDSAKV